MSQLHSIFLQGNTIGGFGVLDIMTLYEKTKIPVIVVLRRYPDYQKIQNTLETIFPQDKQRWTSIKRAGEPIKIHEDPLILLQTAGIHIKDAIQLTKKCTSVGTIPESLRIAHFIGVSHFRFLQNSIEKNE